MKHNFIKVLTTILIVLFYTTSYSQTTIYVNSSTGNDSTGNGTSGAPYKTFYKGYTVAASVNTCMSSN